MPKKILIIYTSVGLGHKVVAENIAAALLEHEVQVELLDILQLYRSRFTKAYEKLYIYVVNYLPGLWRFFYNNKIFLSATLPLRALLAAFKAKKMAGYLARHNPDLVLTTQTTATAIMAYLKRSGRYGGKLVTVFSDYHFHPYWTYPGVDLYLLTIPEQAQAVTTASQLTGLPVSPEFQKDYKLGEVATSFGLSRVKPVVLLMGGSRGWGVSRLDIDELLRTKLDIQLVVLAGQDTNLAEQLSNRKIARLKAFSRLTNRQVAQLFSAAKVLVSKAGGLTIAQALVARLPMVLVHPLPGMEEHNQDYLLGRQAAVAAGTPPETRTWVERLLLDQRYYRELQSRMKQLTVPNAASAAAQAIIDTLQR